jgi:hypothetical protein
MNLIEKLEQEEIQRVLGEKTIPEFAPGDTVIVNVNVVEGNRKRVQAYEGVVIAKRNRGLNSSFIVRKISSREALLPAQPVGQEGSYQGKAGVERPRSSSERAGVKAVRKKHPPGCFFCFGRKISAWLRFERSVETSSI